MQFRGIALNLPRNLRIVTKRHPQRKEHSMARTKRTATRTTRKAPRALDRIKAVAIAQAKALAKQGTMITLQGRKLATAKARQARAALDDGAVLVKSRAVQAVGAFEKVFEDRVGRAIGK